jgi:hypothetical protein
LGIYLFGQEYLSVGTSSDHLHQLKVIDRETIVRYLHSNI